MTDHPEPTINTDVWNYHQHKWVIVEPEITGVRTLKEKCKCGALRQEVPAVSASEMPTHIYYVRVTKGATDG